MVSILSLLVPILLSAVIVFVVSSIIHMVLGYHAGDWKPVPKVDEVQAALRPFNLAPGDYMMPCPSSREGMKDRAFLERLNKGPVAVMTVMPSGPPTMGTSLVLWFLYAVLVGVFAAYITGRALGPGAHYLQVFRFAGTAAFMGYSFALLQNSIWYKRNWAATARSFFDGLLYALLTAGTFGWLWPR